MFTLSIILLIIGILWLIFVRDHKIKVKNEERDFRGGLVEPAEYKNIGLRKMGYLFLAMALILLLLASITQVGTRSVGVATSFNKPTGHNYTSGLHVKAPWIKVHEVDGTVQTTEYFGSDCIKVKISDGGESCIDAAYRWRINNDNADKAFADYSKKEDSITEGVRKGVVSTNMKASINEVFGTWNPLSNVNIKSNMTPEELANIKIEAIPPYETFNQSIKDSAQTKINDLSGKDVKGGLATVLSVTISGFDMPQVTQDRINRINAAASDTKVALQDVATKNAQASGNNKLAASLKDPNVLVSRCIDGLLAGDIQNQPGFSCWPGGGNSVVLPSSR